MVIHILKKKFQIGAPLSVAAVVINSKRKKQYNVCLRDESGKVMANISFFAHQKKQNLISDTISNTVNEEFVVSNLKIKKY